MPERVRLPVLTVLFGLAGGLAAVAFMEAMHLGFDSLWGWLTSLPPALFLSYGLLAVVVSSLATGVLMCGYLRVVRQEGDRFSNHESGACMFTSALVESSPQAARISCPREARTVVWMPLFISASRNA